MEGSVILILVLGAVICLFMVCFFLVIHFTKELIEAFVRSDRDNEQASEEETEFRAHYITRWVKIEHSNKRIRVLLCYKKKSNVNAKNPFGDRFFIRKDAELLLTEFKYN